MTTHHHPEIHLHGRCRACEAPLREVLNLGPMRLNDFPTSVGEIGKIHKIPLILDACTACGLVQLDRTVPPDWMYRTYWYRSGVNETMVAELHDVVRHAISLCPPAQTDVVVDIGANDGTLLAHYKTQLGDQHPRRVGVEPALNLTDYLAHHAEVCYTGYFPAVDTTPYEGRCAIVTAIACAYDVEHPLQFCMRIQHLLKPGGVAILQFQDFAQQLRAAAFDNICHEHLEYYTLYSLTPILRMAGLTVQQALPRAINGGSLRLVLRRTQDHVVAEDSVVLQLHTESKLGLDTRSLQEPDPIAFRVFRQRVDQAKRQITAVLAQITDAGQMVDVYGASTKGNVLLQVLGIGPGQVRQAIDRDPRKVGKFTITGIPIVAEDHLADHADVWLCPIWQFRGSVLARNGWFLEGGGQIVFPLPAVEIVKEAWTIAGEREDG